MSTSLDLTNLRKITAGNAALEIELFGEFLQSSQVSIAGMRAACAANDDEGWRQHAHAFKGTSLILGAMQLGALCKQAQDSCKATAELKQNLLTVIEQEFAVVEKYLKNSGT